MSKHYMLFYTDDSNVKDWEDLNPDKIHHIDFKGKWYDEVRYGKWVMNERGVYECSICRRVPTAEEKQYDRYCSWCGAKMEGDK